MSLLTKLFGGTTEKAVSKYQVIVEKINQLEPQFEAFSNEELKAKTQEFKERLAKDETLDDLLPEAFAAVREAAKRTIGQRHFDAQLIGGMVLHEGKIAEMKTGEGKTLAATLAVYLNALEGEGVHVVTVNDYLSKRDANWMGAIYHALGLSVGCIQHEVSYLYDPNNSPQPPINSREGVNPPASPLKGGEGGLKNDSVVVEMANLKQVSRREAYAADITYGTNNEYGFDYLRDNMVEDLPQMVQRAHHYAIVDEVDSILIDEARTPLIISAPDMDSTKLYETFSKIAPHLKENEDYNIDEKMRTSILTEKGIEKVEKMLGLGNIYTEGGIKYVHHLEQALRAQTLFKRDKDYVVKDGEIVIVDEFTGRLMFGRRYSEGLHQALEAKEGVEVQKESRTLATITFQNYFRMYKKLAGMTGTALTSAEEMSKVYKLEVVPVPTNKPMIRVDMPDSVYRTEHGKFVAVVREIKKRHEAGQPVLVGTVSIEKNERLSGYLKREGIAHELLNAKNHEREAQIIAKAGEPGAVTVATNMAGRGVDIILGGRPEANLPAPLSKGSGGGLNPDWQAKHDQVLKAGGLHIIGTERHEARRIDDQLRGRGGRQGDSGSSQFFVSLEDDLMRIFAPDRIKRMMEILQMPEDQPIENKMISRAIESAQGKIEGFNFDTRKHVLEYDDVMNKQRETIYRKRREILEMPAPKAGEKSESEEALKESEFSGLKEQVQDMLAEEVEKVVSFHAPGEFRDDWNYEEIFENLNTIFPVPPEARQGMKDAKTRDELNDYLIKLAQTAYEQKEKEIGSDQMRNVEKYLYLRNLDMMWMDHLDEMEHLRDSVRLRAYGQKDPLVEYKNEGHRLFQQLLKAIQANFVNMIFKVSLNPPQPQRPMQTRLPADHGPQTTAIHRNPLAAGLNSAAGHQSPAAKKNIGRNDPCWCGSGKKYKKCHGK